MNNRYNSILRLRAIRQFEDRPIDESDLEAVLEAARWTGSSKNRQNWSFVVVDDPQQKERLCEAGDFTVPIANAPVTICLVEESGGYEFDTGRVAQNIMLAADAIGLATCPITLHREDLAGDVLDLPEGRRCRYAVAIGYPAPSAAPRKMGGRKPMDALVHRNTYGG
jgi:nitroreductase